MVHISLQGLPFSRLVPSQEAANIIINRIPTELAKSRSELFLFLVPR